MSDTEHFDSENETVANRFHDSIEFEQLKDNISTRLFEINGQMSTLNQFKTSLKFLLQKGDVNVHVIDKIDKKSIDKIDTIRGLIGVINTLIQEINGLEQTTLDKTSVIAREKLNRDVRYSIQEFQNSQVGYSNIIKSINDKAKQNLNDNKSALLQEEDPQTVKGQGTARIGGQQSQMVVERDPINNEEFVYQQNLIQQREEEIANIQNGITDLNEIFKDLGNVVQQQGIMVDNIEANIYSTSDNTQGASRELNKAMRYQRRSNKCYLYMLAVLSVMLLFLILIIFI